MSKGKKSETDVPDDFPADLLGPDDAPKSGAKELGLNERIYTLVREIPSGRVATYGQIAAIVGRCTPRQAGYAMAAAPEGLQWQRVVNSAGRVSVRSSGDGAIEQRQLLEDEGIVFTPAGKLNFEQCGWGGPDPDAAELHGFFDAPPAGMKW